MSAQARVPKDSDWRQKLLAMLSRREHSAKEAAARLRQSGCPAELGERLVADASQSGLIDDRRCAEIRLRSLLRRGYGKHYAERDLAERGIDADTTQSVLAGQDWRAQAESSCRRRFGERPTAALKIAQYLVRKGFTAETAAAVAEAHSRTGE